MLKNLKEEIEYLFIELFELIVYNYAIKAWLFIHLKLNNS